MSTISELTAKIEQCKQELAKLETQLEVAKTEAEDIILARQLHAMLCQRNHTDGCSWFYEMKNGLDQWNGDAHGRYLSKAHMLIHRCKEKSISPAFAIEIIKMAYHI